MNSAPITTPPTDIFSLTKLELAEALSQFDLKPFRAKQIWRWVYCEAIYDFSKMTDIAKNGRETLAQKFKFGYPQIAQLLESEDGTVKFLLELADGNKIETVYIPEPKRITICVSCQVGCLLKCAFCHTGTQGLTRNLLTSEIIQQIIVVRDFVTKKLQEKNEADRAINLVFMGMGEPFHNYENVAKAIHILMDNEGIAISRRRITISTSGIVPYIRRCAEELKVNLAISLHAASNEIRNQIMPINKKYPIEELIKSCREYQKLANSKRITFEYLMLKGINDSAKQAKELIRLIRGISCIVNLLPFNEWPGSVYTCSDETVMKNFVQIIKKAGHQATIRTPRGRDILAACGQLNSEIYPPGT